MNLFLHRDYGASDCTMGVLKLSNGDVYQTMEKPWIPKPGAPCGDKGHSCVPPGVYNLFMHNSQAHQRTWALVNKSLWVYHFDEDVPVGQVGLARTLVLIHAANYASELRGCIAPGMGRSVDQSGRRMVTNSRKAMAEIQAVMRWTNEHTMEIS